MFIDKQVLYKWKTNVRFLINRGSCWKADYEIYDENHQPVLKLEGPCCICDGQF
jgi:hypothetical protein